MSEIPDFRRAEYDRPPASQTVIEGEVVGRPVAQSRFPLALLFGLLAALVGSAGYALVGLSGFMVSIVSVGIGWLVARSMMTASGGVGGRPYQIAAVLFTYFAVALGEMLHPLWALAHDGLPVSHLLLSGLFWRDLLLGPFLFLLGGEGGGINGILGLLILFFGLRTAWQFAAGSPGFARGTRRPGPFGMR